MKSHFFHFISIVFAFFLISCGNDVPSTEYDERKERQDIEKLAAELSPLTGVYTGLVTNESDGADPFPVELTLTLAHEPIGTNENGRIKIVPRLRVRFRRLDFPTDASTEKNLLVRYDKVTGSIYMFPPQIGTTSPIPGSTDLNTVNVYGYLKGDEINGTINFARGREGKISVRKKRK